MMLDHFRSHDLISQNQAALLDRVDLKFVIPEVWLSAWLPALSDAYTVLELDGVRCFGYDTLYFDTPDYRFYQQHHCGKLNRHKVRLRHYRETGQWFLEIKTKNNRQRTQKERMELCQPQEPADRMTHFLDAYLPDAGRDLIPSLGVHYQRLTLMNPSASERVTLDRDIRYGCVGTGRAGALHGLAVVEIKSARKSAGSPFLALLKGWGIRPTAISKYCAGLALTGPKNLRTNQFKPLLAHLEQLQKRAGI